MSLPEFVARTRAERFQYGVNDCALWCASAVLATTGVDPAADLRGTYASRFECLQVLKRAGGLLALFRARASSVPGVCDFDGTGVAVCASGALRLGAVMLGGRAVMRTEQGLRIVDRPKIVQGWSWRRL